MVNLWKYTKAWGQCIRSGILIIIGLVLINSKGAEGQITVSIQTQNVSYNDVTNMEVSIGSTQTFLVIWRTSSLDVTTLPTSAESIIVQNGDGIITCPANPGGCDRFNMTTDTYSLVFNRVEIADSEQKFWCDANAGDGNGFDSIVPNVCKNGEFDLKLTDEILICKVIGYYPDTGFTLVWKYPNGIEQPSEEDCVTKPTDDGFFERTCTLAPSINGIYTCQAGGNCAFEFVQPDFKTIDYTGTSTARKREPKEEGGNNGLSDGEIAGTVIGCSICVLGIGGGLVYYVVIYKKDK